MRKKLVSFCSTVLMSLSFCVMPMRLSSAEQPTEQIKGAIERISQVLQEVTAARGGDFLEYLGYPLDRPFDLLRRLLGGRKSHRHDAKRQRHQHRRTERNEFFPHCSSPSIRFLPRASASAMPAAQGR